MEARVLESDDYTWLIMDSEEFENFIQVLTHPTFPPDAPTDRIAAYTEYAEMVAEAFKAAHHIPDLKRSSPLTQHVFDIYEVETSRMGVLEEGFDEYAVTIWSMLAKKQATKWN